MVTSRYCSVQQISYLSFRMSVDIGDIAPKDRTVQEWFAKFKSRNFNLEDAPRSSHPRVQ